MRRHHRCLERARALRPSRTSPPPPMTSILRRFATLALGVVAFSGCSMDQSTAAVPRPAATDATASSDLLGLVGSLLSINGLQRTTPLAAPITVSKTIGGDGGTLSI